MSTWTLTTNNHPRPLYSLAELPDKIRADFDYIAGEDRWSRRMFEYRGAWYDVQEFSVAIDDVKALGFDGYQAESYFSAVVVQWFDKDGEYREEDIVVGYIYQ